MRKHGTSSRVDPGPTSPLLGKPGLVRVLVQGGLLVASRDGLAAGLLRLVQIRLVLVLLLDVVPVGLHLLGLCHGREGADLLPLLVVVLVVQPADGLPGPYPVLGPLGSEEARRRRARGGRSHPEKQRQD